jgi:hypothetical protein
MTSPVAVRLPGPGPAGGQLVALPPAEYDWIVVRLDRPADAELEELVWLHYRDGVDPDWLRAPDGADTGRIPVVRHTPLVAVRLPDRPQLGLRELVLIPARPKAA